MSFHEISFPQAIALGARGGPERRTQIVTAASGREERNQLWAHSRRRYNAGYGLRSLADIDMLIAFFEERRGRLYGFRFRDRADHRSTPPGQPITATDQTLGEGDGQETKFQLIKRYGGDHAVWTRDILKPVHGSVVVAVGGAQVSSGWSVNTKTGVVTFNDPPGNGQSVKAGFEFDVPVRFDTDLLEIDLEDFAAGSIPDIPLIEVRP
ncbi:MAG: DUF2460 domain-containing protein [Pseudomonadota bacterium]